MTDRDERVVTNLHSRIPAVLAEIDNPVQRLVVACNDCTWEETYQPHQHESVSMMSARIDADVQNHATSDVFSDHHDYDVDIHTRAPLREIDATITAGYPEES